MPIVKINVESLSRPLSFDALAATVGVGDTLALMGDVATSAVEDMALLVAAVAIGSDVPTGHATVPPVMAILELRSSCNVTELLPR